MRALIWALALLPSICHGLGGSIIGSSGLTVLPSTSPWKQADGIVSLATATNNVVIQTTLTVQGAAFSVGTTTFNVSNGFVSIGTTSNLGYLFSVGGNAVIKATAGATGTPAVFAVDDASGNTLLHVTNSGDIGIGVAVPTSDFDLTKAQTGVGVNTKTRNTDAGAGSYSSNILQNAAGAYLETIAYSNATATTQFGQSVGGKFIMAPSANTLIIGTNDTSPLILGTNGAERARIDGSGNTSIEGSTLAVNGSIYMLSGTTVSVSAPVLASTYTALSISTSANVATVGAISLLSDNTVRFHAGLSSATGRIPINLYVISTQVYTSTNGAVGLSTYTLTANTLANVGDQLYIVCIGTAVSITENKTFGPAFGTKNLVAAVNTGAIRQISESWVTKTGPNAQTYMSVFYQTTAFTTQQGELSSTDTSDIPVLCVGGAANGDSNNTTLDYMRVTYYPAQ